MSEMEKEKNKALDRCPGKQPRNRGAMIEDLQERFFFEENKDELERAIKLQNQLAE